jgi:hypothetical protein
MRWLLLVSVVVVGCSHPKASGPENDCAGMGPLASDMKGHVPPTVDADSPELRQMTCASIARYHGFVDGAANTALLFPESAIGSKGAPSLAHAEALQALADTLRVLENGCSGLAPKDAVAQAKTAADAFAAKIDADCKPAAK